MMVIAHREILWTSSYHQPRMNNSVAWRYRLWLRVKKDNVPIDRPTPLAKLLFFQDLFSCCGRGREWRVPCVCWNAGGIYVKHCFTIRGNPLRTVGHKIVSLESKQVGVGGCFERTFRHNTHLVMSRTARHFSGPRTYKTNKDRSCYPRRLLLEVCKPVRWFLSANLRE